jgi:hypothetical protein
MDGMSPEQIGNPQDPIDAVAAIVNLLVSKCESLEGKVSALEERLETTEKMLFDELIGNIKKLYDDNMRSEGIKGLREKYPDFGIYEEPLNKFYPGSDLYGSLHDMLSKLRGNEGYTDEVGDGEMKRILDELRKQFDFVKVPEPPKVEEVVAETPAEEVKVETPPEPEEKPPEEDWITAEVRKMKKQRSPGITPGARCGMEPK